MKSHQTVPNRQTNLNSRSNLYPILGEIHIGAIIVALGLTASVDTFIYAIRMPISALFVRAVNYYIRRSNLASLGVPPLGLNARDTLWNMAEAIGIGFLVFFLAFWLYPATSAKVRK